MRVLHIALSALTAAGLFLNAAIHLRLAPTFDAITGSILSHGDLFRIQSVVGILAIALLVLVRRWWGTVLAAIVALGGLGMLVVSTLVPLDLTVLGLPFLFEPVWYTDKTVAAVAQATAGFAAAALALLQYRHRHRRGTAPR